MRFDKYWLCCHYGKSLQMILLQKHAELVFPCVLHNILKYLQIQHIPYDYYNILSSVRQHCIVNKNLAIELGFAVQIFTRPLLLRLDAHAGSQINNTNRNEHTWQWIKLNTLCFLPSGNPGVPKYNWINWQWAGFTNHNKHRHAGPERTFSMEKNWL